MFQFKLMLIGIVLAAMGAYGIFQTGQAVYVALLMLGLVLCCGIFSLKLHKFLRDQQIIANAELERQQATPISSALPQMTSEGNSGLFVPPPLS